MTGGEVPPGYTRVRAGQAEIVAQGTVVDAVCEAVDGAGTLYEYAAHHPDARMLVGRRTAYAVPLPDSTTRVVVRRSRHGGLLAPVTGERFLGRTRAPRELEASLRLGRGGVATPDVLAYATYHAGTLLRRADVATREVPESRDLAFLLTDGEAIEQKDEWLGATAALVRGLVAVGARHPDLNLKNILIAADVNGTLEALVLDVDRVWFDRPGATRVAEANLRRLARSARKWRDRHGAAVDEDDLERLRAVVLAPS